MHSRWWVALIQAFGSSGITASSIVCQVLYPQPLTTDSVPPQHYTQHTLADCKARMDSQPMILQHVYYTYTKLEQLKQT